MSDVSRRDAVKLAAALAVGAIAASEASGEVPRKATATKTPDPKLKLAFEDPEAFMFPEMVTFKTDHHTEHLEFGPVKVARSGYDVVLVPTGAMRIFGTDLAHDEFTKQGGVYWRCGKTNGKFQFKTAATFVMVVRDLDGTTRCYSMAFDLRC